VARRPADFQAAVDADPANTGAHRQLGRLLWSRGLKAASLPHWERVANLEPTDAQARYRRAEAATHAERWADAIAWLERDVEELPQPAAFRQLLARTLSVAPSPLRNADRALPIALAEHERSPRLRQAETVAIAHAGRGDFEAARRWQTAALTAVETGGRLERHGWVVTRLALFETGTQEPRPFRAGERRGTLRVDAP
jgi:tetratricopeptide (TPR) repeat protein